LTKLKKTKNSAIKGRVRLYVIFGFVLLLALILASVVGWSIEYFGVGLEQIIFTLTSPMKGANSGVVVVDAFKTCLPAILSVMAVYIAFAIIDCKLNLKLAVTGKIGKKLVNFNLSKVFRAFICILCVVALFASAFYANSKYDVVGYVKQKNDTTTIYEDYYIDPRSVNITADSKPKNLICIYLESMEVSYSSTLEGGFQSENLIPNLTELAYNNISFSNFSDKALLGGFHSVTGTTWTMGALFAFNTGVPFAFPVDANAMSDYEKVASGIVTLGDVLKDKGYTQMFMCGSDGEFGGRKTFFEQHGDYNVFDYYAAIKNKYINEDYYVFWGLEDKKLYNMAKDELTKLSKSSKPFNFSLLTVDTHFPDGYICDLCGDEYGITAKNVVSCADKQIAEFIAWCKEQDFYKDTVIVLLGDHPRMETVLVPENYIGTYRLMYNCILNSDFDKELLNTTNRTFTAMDCFPTVLAAMGFNIEGDRLGLGTNMLSGKQTLPEEMGLEKFKSELSKRSNYYVKQFK